MSTLFKVLLFVAPVVGIVYYFVVIELHKADIKHEQAHQEFIQKEDDFDEEYEVALDPEKTAALYKKRAAARAIAAVEAKKRQEELAGQAKTVEGKEERYRGEFEKAMGNYEREHAGKVPPEVREKPQ